MKTWETPKGKEIKLYYEGRNLAIQFGSGGELPVELQGVFTNETEAEKAILKYLDTKKKDDIK